MSILVGNPFFLDAGAGGAYEIERSLRFNSSDSAYLSKVYGSNGNRTTWTISFWMKLGRLNTGQRQKIFGAGTDYTNTGITYVELDTNNQLQFYTYILSSGGYIWTKLTSQVFRDASSWYHVCCIFDSSNGTSADRARVYVNGARVTAFASSTDPSLNYNSTVGNSTQAHHISGPTFDTAQYFDGYLADVHFIDGQALDPSSFVAVSATTGQLIPKQYTGSFGTNGFWLKFSDNSAATATTLGKDYSGNSNNWTPNNLTATVSGNRYAQTTTGTAPNPYLSSTYIQAFDGNTSTSFSWTAGTWAMNWSSLPSAVTVTSTLRIYCYPRLGTLTVNINGSNVASITGNSVDWRTISFTGTINTISFNGTDTYSGVYAIEVDGTILVDYQITGANIDSLVDTPTSYGTDTGIGGEVRGNYCTFNPLFSSAAVTTNGNLTLYGVNDGKLGTMAFPSTGKWYYELTMTQRFGNYWSEIAIRTADNSSRASFFQSDDGVSGGIYLNGVKQVSINTGVDGDLCGLLWDADSRQVSFFRNGSQLGTTLTLSAGIYFPFCGGSGVSYPSQAAISNVNFGQRPWAYPANAVGAKALCDTNLPAPTIAKSSTVMDVKLYTGNGSTQTISGLGFSPDLVWVKSRSAGWWHVLTDTVRGGSAWLHSNVTNAEATNGLITGFTSDGFTLSASPNGTVNENNDTYVAWTWDAGSSTVPNNAGSIASQVRVNQSAGFSIVGFTVPSNGTDFTVGHGLGVTPSLIITKGRNIPDNWVTFHSSVSTTTALFLRLNTADSLQSISGIWGTALPNSTVFGGRSGNILNPDQNAIAYCFAPVAGYSAFGSYTGNGSSDGPFVFLGFRPRVLWIKETSGAGNWLVWDSARETFNVTNDVLCPNLATTGFPDEATLNLDMTSNGFKLRATSDDYNGSGATFIYCAWAESPFAYARAR